MGPINRPLDLDWLEDFIALAESGNFSRAAQARSIAQPAFSRHIKSLEEWAGIELIDRGRHPAAPTPAGEVLLATAREVVLRLSQSRTRAQEAAQQASNRLQFAATHVLSLAFFPVWLQKIEQYLQLGPIHMVSDSFQACEELMLQRRVQFLLCYSHPAVATRLLAPDFVFHGVGADQLIPVSTGHAAGPRFRLDGAQVQPTPFLAYSHESALGKIMQQQLPQLGDPTRFQPAITSHHAVLLKAMALDGRGVAWLPRSLVNAEIDDGRLVLHDDPAYRIALDIRLYRACMPMSAAAEGLWAKISAN